MFIQPILPFECVPIICPTQAKYHSIAPCLAGQVEPKQQAKLLNLSYSNVSSISRRNIVLNNWSYLKSVGSESRFKKFETKENHQKGSILSNSNYYFRRQLKAQNIVVKITNEIIHLSR